ncbi:MAG: MBG domain-containing protein, partial [Isosphaeraceae bacterium]|nr:MBG domain-containing protein [Isosphaeraceae bacterium]
MISVERSPNSTVTAQGSGRKSRPPDAGEADSVDAHGPPAHAVPGVRCRGRNRKFRRAEAAACWLEELDRRELLTTFLVTNTADAGTGSLRAAILNADSTSGPSEIQFAIGSGLQTIQPLSALPPITEPVTIDGTTQPGFAGTPIIDIDGSLSGTTIAGLELQSSGSTIRGLVINHFSDRALYLDSGASNNLIVGDYLGTDFTGNVAEPNGLWGVDMIDAGSGNTVGGVAPADRNIIASNQYGGIALNGASVTNTAIIGNDIGVGADGSTPLGNAYAGVLTMNGASDNQIGGAVPGQGNVIANNGEGVIIWGGVGNAILGNQIYGNSSLGIDLNWDGVTPNHVGSVSGPNNDQNSPVLTQAVTDGAHLQVSGSLNSTPNTTFRIEFFANPVADPSGHGQGQTYLGFANVTTDSSGNATIAVQLQAIVAPGQAISATATDAGGNTSEFAQDVAATAGSTIVVDTTSDVDDGNTASITALLRNRGPDGLISLREAILAVDNTPGFDTIDFDIPGAGIQTIIPSGALPHVTNPVVLDATSQPGYAGTPLIELDGTLLPFSADGIEVNAPSTTVEGFSIYGFSGNGIKVDAVGLTAIKGNLIGLRGDGALAPSNGTGIVLSGATGTTIGGSSTSNANVIAGNTSGGIRIEGGASGNAVLGNLIGTDPSGTTAIANGYGIEINGSANNTIGGTTPVAGNVISGNTSDGIDVEAAGSSGNLIEGNLLGTNAGRGLPLANGGNGITISLGATNDTIGGTAAGAGNVIANSALDGVAVTGGNGIAILADSFQANAGMGIDLEQNPGASTDGALTPGQPNQGMNVPVFSSAVWNGSSLTVSGYVGQPNTGGAGFANDRIEVYLLDGTAGGSQSQGRTLIGVLTSSSQGAFSGTLTGEGISASSAVTGTATAPSDGTSEFATAVAATSPGGLIATTTTLQASTAISTYGQKVTFTATVNGPLGLVQFATGSVTFYDGSVVLGTSTVSGGTATLSTTTLAAGTVEMSATYNGDVLDEASDSAALPQMINPAPLTITANAAAKAYGQNLPSFTASYAGLVNGDTPANLSSTFRLEFSTAANASSPAGNYSLSPYGFNDPNYAPTYVASTLTVTPAPLTVEAVSQSKVYGQPAPLLTVRFCGLVNGDTPADLTGLVLTSPATQSSPVGTYRITPSGIVSTNYFITYVDSTLTITPAPLTVQTDNSARVYGQPNPAFTGTISGLTNSDTTTALGTLTFSTDATQSSPVGSYNVTPGGLSDPNYTISYAPGALMVTPAPVTVTADNASKVYGQPNPDFTATYSGLVNGDTPLEIGTLALSTTETQASPVGA